MTPTFFVLTTFALLVAVVLFSFWQDRHVTRVRPPAGHFVDTAEGKVHLITRGEGKGDKLPVVMLHGSFTNALDMDIDLAGKLAKDRQVILPDRPGHGFSDRGPDSWRVDVQVAAMREAVKKQGADRYVLCGQSYGAATALVWALAYPEDVAGLVLVAPVTHPWPYGVRWYIRMGNNPRYGWLFRRSFIALYSRYGAPRGVARALRGCKAAPYYYERSRTALSFRAAEFHWNAQDICRLYEQLVPMEGLYPKIKVPTEVVAGTHDLTVILPIHGRRLADQLPDCNLDIIDGGGHALHHSHPERCLDAIDRVDQRLEMAARSPLESALRAITAVFPQRTATK
ncbi:alpha/beta fold hydrolase [Parvularcula lutaonensis]|uniref:Alpha/beta fold hydrolase n=1 Tax=Parvularcula lutaonensis TaxID=491923 RepID=A0ABV7ME07_9PROT|nr:alpha/beta hydrolase [Parvularcula lutaonensis]GGY49481.1 esterase [Parvularcula lutaonensis]